MRYYWLAGLLIVFAAGCAPRTAKVSGKVTLDGKPLAGAIVNFIPLANKDNLEAPDSSSGTTDQNGEFTLEDSKGASGAVVGKHKVIISCIKNAPPPPIDDKDVTGDERHATPRKGGGPPVKDLVPAKYNTNSILTFDVPSGGTDSANFDLTTK